MDVTSLLNPGAAAAAAAEQQKKTASTRSTPTRSRTPWDAGGYSLPINTILIVPQSMTSHTHQYDGSRRLENQTPASPKHKFSDSRSSSSSFTSSLQSTTHSRYSSMSTVNSTHLIGNLSLDSLSPKLRNAPRALELATIESVDETRHSTSLSPTGSLDTLALVTEHHPFSQQPRRPSPDEVVASATEKGSSQLLPDGLSQGRPCSPSDAILIKRSAIPVLRVNTRDSDVKRPEILEMNENFLNARLDNNQHQAQYLKSHQRSFSAPTFWPIMGDLDMQEDRIQKSQCQESNIIFPPLPQDDSSLASIQSRYPSYSMTQPICHKELDNEEIPPDSATSDSLDNSRPSQTNHTYRRESFPLGNSAMDNSTGSLSTVGPRGEPTPPLSHHPDHPSPNDDNPAFPAPDTPPTTQSETDVSCMFVTACNTGSQLRKAISHILGRNKLCTRQIPKEIWVHFCRKHYQRSRYRNPKEYSKLQCDLVQKQIRRIHDWSRNNAACGRPGIVIDWELTIRKREQKRLDELSSTGRKRRSTTFDQKEDNDDNEDDHSAIAANHRSSHVLTAVPQWLLDCCRKGYTTREILEVFNRLHTEILADRIAHFPDIEILPNITSDEAPMSPTSYTERNATAVATHRRTQSLGMATLQSTSPSPISRSIRHGSVWSEENFQSYPQEKRRRSNGRTEETFDERDISRSRHSEGSNDTGRRIPQFTHRPVFPDIRENHYEEQYGESHYIGSPSSYQAPLPAPTPQQSNGHSMAAQLENNGYAQVARRSVHSRSQSDIGGFGYNQIDFTSPAPGFGPYQARHFPAQDRVQQTGPDDLSHPQYLQPQYRSEPPRWPESRMNESLPRQVHQRHKSISIVPSSHTVPHQSYNRQTQLPHHPPPQHNLPFAPRRVSETDEARDLYSARR